MRSSIVPYDGHGTVYVLKTKMKRAQRLFAPTIRTMDTHGMRNSCEAANRRWNLKGKKEMAGEIGEERERDTRKFRLTGCEHVMHSNILAGRVHTVVANVWLRMVPSNECMFVR